MVGHASVLSTNALTIGLDKASNGPANPQSINRYSYVLNRPVRWTDPTGHQYTCNAYVCGIPSGGNTGGTYHW
jgi:hypothetical protein